MGTGKPRLLIRELVPGDAPSLLAVHQRAITATSDRFYTQEQRESWGAGLTPDGYLDAAADGEVFEVALVEDRVVAFCSRRESAVIGLYVDPANQGQGIGRMLLKRAEAAFGRNGVRRTEVRASLPAVGFYQRQGYAVVGEETHRTRGGLPLEIKVMAKRLD